MNEKYTILDNIDHLTENYISEGQNGICYKVDNQVFKKFKNKPMFLFFLKSMSEIKSKSFVFPNEFIYLNTHDKNGLQGYMMDYIEGPKLSKLEDIKNLKDFIIKLDLLEKEIKDLTQNYGLLIRDIHPENIIYDNEFHIIDNDNNVFNPADDLYTNYRANMAELGNTMLPYMFRYNISDIEEISKLYNMCILQGKCKPSIVIDEAIKLVEDYKKEKIETLEEFHNGIELILKK